MRVNVADLLAERGADRTLAFSEQLAAPGDDITFAEPVTGELTLRNNGGVLSLRGRLRTVAVCVCGACLRPFRLPLAFEVAEEFRRPVVRRREATAAPGGHGPVGEHDGGEERELASGDFVASLDAGDTVNVTEVVRQHAALALPLAPRCRETCAGLCPHCGADLNAGSCGCKTREIDPRMEALRRWRGGPQTGKGR